MSVIFRNCKFGIGGTRVRGRGWRFEGNLTVSFVRESRCASPCHIAGNILTFRAQLNYVSSDWPQSNERNAIPEAVQYRHFLHRCSDQRVQHHCLIRYPPNLCVFFQCMFFPLSTDLEILHIGSYISRHQPIESHREGACHATAIWPAITAGVAYVVVRS